MKHMESMVTATGSRLRCWAVAVLFVLFAVLPILASGCASQPAAPSATRTRASAATTATPSSRLVPINANGRGELKGVSVGPSRGFGFAPGTPSDRAYKRYGHRADVGVFDSVRGIETELLVPMWYGKATTYSVVGQSKTVPLERAVADKSVTWWGSPGASVRYHLEDGYFVLDHMTVAQSR